MIIQNLWRNKIETTNQDRTMIFQWPLWFLGIFQSFFRTPRRNSFRMQMDDSKHQVLLPWIIMNRQVFPWSWYHHGMQQVAAGCWFQEVPQDLKIRQRRLGHLGICHLWFQTGISQDFSMQHDMFYWLIVVSSWLVVHLFTSFFEYLFEINIWSITVFFLPKWYDVFRDSQSLEGEIRGFIEGVAEFHHTLLAADHGDGTLQPWPLNSTKDGAVIL